MTVIVRAVRNNNPTNLRHGQPWQGLSVNQPDPAFCTFIGPMWGFRAAAEVIRTYHGRGWVTTDQIIGHWAPASENDTSAYEADVAGKVGAVPTFDHAGVCALVKAISEHECGGWFFDDGDLAAGVAVIYPT